MIIKRELDVGEEKEEKGRKKLRFGIERILKMGMSLATESRRQNNHERSDWEEAGKW